MSDQVGMDSTTSRAQLQQLLEREGATWWRGIFEEAQRLVREQNHRDPRVRLVTELRERRVFVRDTVTREAVLLVLLPDAEPPGVELRTLGSIRQVIHLRLGLRRGQLVAGVEAKLDPAGLAHRALETLLAITKAEHNIHP
jgi:hypothetical protein